MKASLLLVLVAGACASSAVSTAERQPEPARTRAALATVTVDNRTTQRLTILYALTTRPNATVIVGRVDSMAVTPMAPIPAGEPLVLTARNTAGFVYVLLPRSFEIDGAWTWIVPADARFTAPPARAP